MPYQLIIPLTSKEPFEEPGCLLPYCPCVEIINQCKVVVHPSLCLRRDYSERVGAIGDDGIYCLPCLLLNPVPVDLDNQKGVIDHLKTFQEVDILNQYPLDMCCPNGGDIYFVLRL